MSEPEAWRQRWSAQLPEGAEPRSGQVLALSVRRGRVVAQVQGGAAAPYHVELLVDVLDEHAWQRATETIAGQARHRAALHAGRLPDELVDDLAAADADLIDVGRVDPRCPCRAEVALCRHANAVWQALARQAASDPFTLTELRGRGRQQLLAALAAARRRGGDHEQDAVAVADLDPSRWRRGDAAALGADPPGLVSGPTVELGSLRLLGDPPGWRGPADAADTFGPMIAAGAQRAVAVGGGADLLHGPDPDETASSEPRDPEAGPADGDAGTADGDGAGGRAQPG